ncbi:hypothetical protein [Ornithinimicrobium sp. INDO-MA30-4]|uniref:hypothetical protein n=1 Tax=Ornithinimicrobium sp. INDO-MA30-4 TaxID=2908651 RepID=UPI001F2F40C5|nr:hypothetical protein [Ornithinimicrobium sp. INDO-MA30-4]UJH69550.1 hypothetical protein L0A91_09230 [Ornithinimicrobium sp. INDO-MA30-4]
MSGDTDRPRLYLVGMFLVCIYGGYFGAGAGVLFLALILIGTATPMAFALMQRAFLLGIANLVSAIVFMFIAPVAWPQRSRWAPAAWWAASSARRCGLHPRAGPALGGRDCWCRAGDLAMVCPMSAQVAQD